MVKKIIAILIILIIASSVSAVLLRREVERKWAVRYSAAVEMFDQEQYEEALTALLALKDAPWAASHQLDIAYRLGACCYRTGKSSAAKRWWEDVREAGAGGPFGTDVLAGLAFIKEEEGDMEGALASYEDLLDAAPDAAFVPDVLISMGNILFDRGDRDLAAERYERLRVEFPDTEQAAEAVTKLGDINLGRMLSPVPDEMSAFHIVKSGESLDSIAKKYGTTIEYLRIANEKKSTVLRPRERLKVLKGRFRIEVDVDRHALDLLVDQKFVKRYPVGTGKYESTPLGTFRVTDKLVDPVWHSSEGVFPPGHKKNILGSRWLGINRKGYGIHGTTLPETVGQSSSAGCIRMFNNDVEELYDLVPEGTEVVINRSVEDG